MYPPTHTPCAPCAPCTPQALRPKLTQGQKEQLMECFDLMDADGSGAIDADEMGAAFKVGAGLCCFSSCQPSGVVRS